MTTTKARLDEARSRNPSEEPDFPSDKMDLGRSAERARKLRSQVEEKAQAVRSRLDTAGDKYHAEALAEEKARLLEELHEETSDALAELRRLDNEGEEILSRWKPSSLRRRAKFSDDPATDAAAWQRWQGTLEKVPVGDLVDYARDAARDGNIALARAIELEVANREIDGGEKLKIGKALAEVKLPPSMALAREEAVEDVAAIREAAEFAELAYKAARRPSSVSAFSKLRAARRAEHVRHEAEDRAPA